jgi:hypothetical protein
MVECHYAVCRCNECRYTECHFLECSYAECCYAKCGGAVLKTVACTNLRKICKFALRPLIHKTSSVYNIS